jgi:tRNA 2-selenouridine synthase
LSIKKIDTEAFIKLCKTCPVIDVRSPGEYEHAHIPNAYSLPLFSDEERKVVGTAYKQKNRETAIKHGLDFFGPKMRAMVEAAEDIVKKHAALGYDPSGKKILVHCWRGGMRSEAVAWLLDLYGFDVYTLIGGYKTYRRWVLVQFELTYPFVVLGGYTGSGKTYLLQELEKNGAMVINLEGIAQHKGSAFGAIGMPEQPSQEMFENLLAKELSEKNNTGQIWVEDESQRIGLVNVPVNLWSCMRTRPIYFLDIPFDERLKHITEEYGNLDRERMEAAITRIGKRLGPLETKTAVQLLNEGNISECFRILLMYYDKWYLRGLNNREGLEQILVKIPAASVNATENTGLLEKSCFITEY